MTTAVVPPPGRTRWEAIHGALVLAALLHLAGLGAWSLRTPGAGVPPEDGRDLRVVARVERLEALPRAARLPAPVQRSAAPPAHVQRSAGPPAPARRSAGPPARRETMGALPGGPASGEGLPALPGVSFPTASGPGAPVHRSPRPAPLPSPSPAPRPEAPASAARTAPAPPAPAPGRPRWAWVPGPDQPRLVDPGTLPPGGTGVPGTVRAWMELRIPAGGGASTSPVDIQVLETEAPGLAAGGEARLRDLATGVARSSRWRPGTRDGQPADHVLRLQLELPGS